MTYDVVIRHQTHTPGDWDEAVITVIRPDSYDPSGPCSDAHPEYENDISIRLHESDTNTVALRDLCLEQGKVYKFRVTFKRQRYYEPSPAAQILIDSVVLVPRIEVSSFFIDSTPENTRLKDFYDYGCNRSFYEINYIDYLRPECKDIIDDVSIFFYDGATREFNFNLFLNYFFFKFNRISFILFYKNT